MEFIGHKSEYLNSEELDKYFLKILYAYFLDYLKGVTL